MQEKVRRNSSLSPSLIKQSLLGSEPIGGPEHSRALCFTFIAPFVKHL